MTRICLILVGIILWAGAASGQDRLGIAAVVNDRPISHYDLQTRIDISLVASGLADTAENRSQLVGPVLRGLIDEALQIQEAERQGIKVTDEDMARAVAEVENRAGLKPGGLDDYLREVKIERSALEQQIRSQLLWGKYISQRLRPRIDITEEEVDAEIARRAANKGKPEYLLSMIDLYFDGAVNQDEVRGRARQLVEQIQGGGNFAAVAQQFGQAASAASGGSLGWLQADQLNPQIAQALASAEPGAVVGPIDTVEGVHIALIRDRRLTGSPTSNPGTAGRVRLTQVLLPVDPVARTSSEAEQMQLARTIIDSVKGCDDLAKMISEMASKLSGDLGWMQIADLPAQFRDVVAALEVGRPSQPVTTDAGVHVLMVCERETREPQPAIDERGGARANLLGDRLEVMARGLLRDLRRSAFIDIRL